MKTFFLCYLHEIKRLCQSPITHGVLALFLTIMAVLYFFLLAEYSEAAQDTPAASAFFEIFWLPTLVIVPLICMRSLAEEKRQGMLETFFVTPARPLLLTFAKFSSVYTFYIFAWGSTFFFPWVLHLKLGSAAMQAGLMDKPSLIGGYLFVAVSSFAYVAVGIFASSLTKSQLAAGMLAFALLFAWIIGTKILLTIPSIESGNMFEFKIFLEAIDPFIHLSDFSRGIIDSRPVILYPALGIFFLGLTSLTLEAKA